jgi:hypothetical protein
MSTFGYAFQSPLKFTDPKGLLVYVCVRTAFQSVGGLGNHYYLWDDQTRRVCGRTGGDPYGFEPGPPTHQCYPVNESAGREDDFFSCCERRSKQGLYVPFVNDCRNTVDDCITAQGATLPTLPGRMSSNCSSCYKPPEPYIFDFR